MPTTTSSVSRELVRVGGHLREVVTVSDSAGNILHRSMRSLMLEVRSHDLLQIIVGATILAIPVGFTEEVWRLSTTLPTMNIVAIATLSVTFIAAFVYHNVYRHHFTGHRLNFLKRVVAIYVLSLCAVGLILGLIEQAPWFTDFTLALKRTILVALPASMSAAVVDMIK